MSPSASIRFLICVVAILTTCYGEKTELFKGKLLNYNFNINFKLFLMRNLFDDSHKIHNYYNGVDVDEANTFVNLKIQDLENAIQYGTQQINMLSRHEDSLSYANIDVKIGSPSHGQLIDSKPSIDGHLASRNAEIIIKASHYLVNKHCQGYEIKQIYPWQ